MGLVPRDEGCARVMQFEHRVPGVDHPAPVWKQSWHYLGDWEPGAPDGLVAGVVADIGLPREVLPAKHFEGVVHRQANGFGHRALFPRVWMGDETEVARRMRGLTSEGSDVDRAAVVSVYFDGPGDLLR